MKITKNNKKRVGRNLTIGFLALLVIIGIPLVFYLVNKDKSQTLSTKTEQSVTRSNSTDAKNNNDKKTTLPDNSESKTADNIPTSVAATIKILSVSQSNGKVDSVAQVNSDTGVCVFQYTTDGDKPVTTQSTVMSKECRSSVPEIQFSRLGVWKLTVVFYVNSEKVEAVQDVTVR